jgi:uncharacterized membrane protein YjjB (DUF3815 family)
VWRQVDGTGTQETDGLELTIPPPSHDSLGEILAAELELGRLLFTAGAAGQRIRDSITALNEKLHGGKLDIFPGFEALILTQERAGERKIAMCEYPMPAAMNSNAIMEISRYLHALPEGISPSRARSELGTLDLRRPQRTLPAFLAATLFTIIFGYFNHADPWALVIIAIAAFLAAFTLELAGRAGHSYYICILSSTLAGTISAALLSQILPTGTPLVSLIIPCVFLMPSFHLINGGWEIFRNHMHLGIPGVMVYLNVLAIIALGVFAVLLTYNPGPGGAGIVLPPGWTLVIDAVLGALATLCFCVLVNTPRQALFVCLLCGAAGRFVRTLIVVEGGDVALAVLCGTLLISVIALVLCRNGTIPIVLPIVTASVQFAPGYYFISSLQGIATILVKGASVPYGVVAATLSTGFLAFFICLAIIFGTLLPLLAFGKDTRWY